MNQNQESNLDRVKVFPWRDLARWLVVILVGGFIYQISWGVGFALTLLAVIALGIYENHLRKLQRKEFVRLLAENIFGWTISERISLFQEKRLKFSGNGKYETLGDSGSVFDANFLKLQRRHGLQFFQVGNFEALLVPEPANATRPNAVAVCIEELILGYLPQTVAASVSQKLINSRKCASVPTRVILSSSASKNVLRLDIPKKYIEI